MSNGLVQFAAMIVPASGREPFRLNRLPLLTPSTCKSIHHTPGMPSKHHWFAFRRRPPAGSHCMRESQTIQAKMRSGSRRLTRKICQGRRRGLVGGGVMGKKGAMPEPGYNDLASVRCCRVLCALCTYLCRGTARISPSCFYKAWCMIWLCTCCSRVMFVVKPRGFLVSVSWRKRMES